MSELQITQQVEHLANLQVTQQVEHLANLQVTQQVEQFAKLNISSIPEFSLNGKKLLGRVVSVYDGDTITVALNIFGAFYKFSVRLAGIDTCEIKSKDDVLKKHALTARNRLISIICNTSIDDVNSKNLKSRKDICTLFEKNIIVVSLECHEFDKYGRLLAKVYPIGPAPGLVIGGDDISETLVKEKLAYRYGGDTKLTEGELRTMLIESSGC